MPATQGTSVELKPYIRSDSMTEEFVVGLRGKDAVGPRVSIRVPYPLVARAVMKDQPLSVHLDSDGELRAEMLHMDDEVFEEIYKSDRLERTTIDQLVRHTLEMDRNEPNEGEDGVLPMYAQLRESLMRALTLVDEEVARRSAAPS